MRFRNQLSFILLAVMLVFFIVPQTVHADLLAHFNFNGVGGIVPDVTDNGHDGTITGNITFGPGQYGKALVDDGTGYVALAPDSGTNIQFGGHNSTVTAWINTTSTQAMAFIGKFNPANGGTHEAQDHLMGVNYTAGVFTVDNGWVGSTNGTTQVTDGQWHFVAWTQAQDGAGASASWTLYVDGIGRIVGVFG